MASKDQMAIAQEAREQELLERLSNMEALLARQSEQLNAILAHFGLSAPTEVAATEPETPAVTEEMTDEGDANEAATDEKPASDGKPSGKPKDK